ncbi:YfbU family protein [Priestia filamentosa]|uniref:YfbU family protein n=1 Tax=Priestia filamentosa TaxID=1402861 RepID=UPI002E1F8AB5|nr:YfbU family protein [Priestia filamentosa]
MSLNFSKEQRALLINQFEVLKHLDSSNSKSYDNKIEILQNGYSDFYDEIAGNISDEFPKDQSQKVWDILKLYRKLYFSYENLTPEEQEQIDEEEVIFQGFDGNEESNYYVFAKFIVEKAERYSEINELIKKGKVDMNSHWPKLNYYDGLLSRLMQLNDEDTSQYLACDQIKYILNK